MTSGITSRRPRGQAGLATERLGNDLLDKNMVIRCSSELYERAREAAGHRSLSLSDYVRALIIQDLD